MSNIREIDIAILERLKFVRDELFGGNGTEMGRLCGVTGPTVSRALSGKSSSAVYRLVRCLEHKKGISPEWIETGEGEMLRGGKKQVQDNDLGIPGAPNTLSLRSKSLTMQAHGSSALFFSHRFPDVHMEIASHDKGLTPLPPVITKEEGFSDVTNSSGELIRRVITTVLHFSAEPAPPAPLRDVKKQQKQRGGVNE